MSVLLAHGIGVRGDLPLPLWMVSYGAAFVLIASFGALAVLWRRPLLERPPPGAPLLPAPATTAGEWLLRLSGAVATAAVFAAAFAGPASVTRNLAPYAIYVAFWTGLLLVSGVVGDVWRALSPFETAARLAGQGSQLRPLDRLGHWPAALLLLAYTWLELVYPIESRTDPRVLGQAAAVYAALMAVGVAWWGWRWLRSAEAFGVLFTLIAHMAPLHRDEAGRLRLRAPLVGLARLEVRRGTAAVVLVALGSTTFDGLTRQPFWEALQAGRDGWATVALDTAGLVLAVAAVSALYLWAMREAARRTARTTRELTDAFVHSLVPIALAYAVAHYLSLLVFEGQRVLALASDPLGLGWDLFGTAGWAVDYRAVSAATIAWLQAGAIVAGHLAGVVLAHDRAVALFDSARATRSQFALLVAMVGYTVGGLVLLLGGGG